MRGGAVWSARRVHTSKCAGSNPAPATKFPVSVSCVEYAGLTAGQMRTVVRPAKGAPPLLIICPAVTPTSPRARHAPSQPVHLRESGVSSLKLGAALVAASFSGNQHIPTDFGGMKITTHYAIGAKAALKDIIERQRTTGRRLRHVPVTLIPNQPTFDENETCDASEQGATRQINGGAHVVDR